MQQTGKDKSFWILIVDDVPQNVQLVANLLKDEGYQMAFAHDGRTALKNVMENEFDLILLDVLMPEMDGFEVCKALKQSPITIDIPVIFLTVKDEIEYILKGFEAGAVDYVTKPFIAAEVLTRVRTHIEMKKKRDEEQELIITLETAVANHKRSEKALQQLRNNLELLVEERTAELLTAYNRLMEKIEERRQAEDALKQIEARYNLITENMSDTIWLMDMDLKTTWISPSVERTRGFSLEEINSLPMETQLAPDSLKIVLNAVSEELTPQSLQQKDLNISKIMDLEFYRHDGSTCWSEVMFTLLRDKLGNPIGIVGVGRNITERKQAEDALKDSEQMLKRVIHGSPIPAFVIGKDHRVRYWNRALEELSGIRTEEVVGTAKHWRAFYSEERPCMADLLVDQVLEVIPQWYFEKYVKSVLIEDAYEAIDFFPALGDTGKWLRFTAAVIRDSQGEPVGAIETLQDVTERKQARDTLEKLVQERTADLSMKNVQLINEIKERKQAEAELKRRKREVETKSQKLEELNTTLKTLLKHRDEDKKEMEGRVMSNVKVLLIPSIEKLKNRRLDAKSMFFVSMLESNLSDIISPFSHKLSSKYIYMTSKEIQVANLVKEGKSTKEIAEMMDVSSHAVELHRFHIRKKLGLKSRGINLKSYLLSIS